MTLETIFRTVYGRDPRAEEIERLRRIGRELGVRDNDAVWIMMLLMGHAAELAMELPKRIERMAVEQMVQFKAGMEAARRSAEAEFALSCQRTDELVKRQVATAAKEGVAEVAESAMRAGARRATVQWILGGVLAACALVAGAYSFGRMDGERSGYGEGYGAALDVKAAASWANTDAGRSAWRLWKTGEIEHLARCDKQGWQRDTVEGHSRCVPYETDDHRVYGWWIE